MRRPGRTTAAVQEVNRVNAVSKANAVSEANKANKVGRKTATGRAVSNFSMPCLMILPAR